MKKNNSEQSNQKIDVDALIKQLFETLRANQKKKSESKNISKDINN
ncbi:MAG: hypothetical protein ACQEWL_19650 [Pseudomonadota bacterium]